MSWLGRVVAANAIESLLSENERLEHNLTSTEQTQSPQTCVGKLK